MSNKIRYQQILFSGDAGNSPFVAGTDGGVLLPDLVIEAGSSSRLSFNPTTRELSLTSLGVVKVTVDTIEPDMATFAANQYPTGTEFQEGDTIILTAATGGPQTWIHNGGTSGTAADFTVIETPNLTDAYIRALFSSANAGINYNNLTGVFTFTLDPSANNLATITPSGLFVDDTRIDNLETLSGVAGATNLGTFTGTTIPDNTTIKVALQSLETALEATTYTNGLTKTVNDVELGGTLDHATSIVQNGFSFDITNVLLSGATTAIRSGENSFFGADGITEMYQNATHRAVDFVGDGSAIGLTNPVVINAVSDLTNTVTASMSVQPGTVKQSAKNTATADQAIFNVDVTGGQGFAFLGASDKLNALAGDEIVIETSYLAPAGTKRFGFSAWSPTATAGNSSADHYVIDPVLGIDISLFQTKIGALYGTEKYGITNSLNYNENGFTIFDNESTYWHGGVTTGGVPSLTAAQFMRLNSTGIELKTNAGILDINTEVALEDSYLPNNPAAYRVLVRDTATGKMSELTTMISGQSNHEEGQATGAVTTTFTVPTLSSGWSTPSGYKVVVYKNGQRLAHDAGLSANTYRVNSATQFEIDSRLASDIIVWEVEKA